jgi:hypothetical protein
MSAAAACVKHPAGHAIIYFFFIYHLVPAVAACMRYPADDYCHCYVFITSIIVSFIQYILFSACSGSMRKASCGSMMPAIIIYLSFIYYLVSAVAACVRYPAGHAIIIYVFINLLFSVCSSSMRKASCGSIMPAIIIYLLFVYY